MIFYSYSRIFRSHAIAVDVEIIVLAFAFEQNQEEKKILTWKWKNYFLWIVIWFCSLVIILSNIIFVWCGIQNFLRKFDSIHLKFDRYFFMWPCLWHNAHMSPKRHSMTKFLARNFCISFWCFSEFGLESYTQKWICCVQRKR